MYTGQVSIKRDSNTVQNVVNWFQMLDPSFKKDVELLELVQRALQLFKRIPKGKHIAICYQEGRELIGSELIFSNFKAGFFTVTATSSHVDYYVIDRSVEKAAKELKLKEPLFNHFKKQLTYRLDYLAKKLQIFNMAPVIQGQTKVARLSNSSVLARDLQLEERQRLASPISTGNETIGDMFAKIDKSVDEKVIQLYRKRRAEADNPNVDHQYDTSALNGRVSVFCKSDLHNFYMKELKIDPELTNYYAYATRGNKKSLPSLHGSESKQGSVDGKSSLSQSTSMPFFVKRFSKQKEKMKEEKLKTSTKSILYEWFIQKI